MARKKKSLRSLDEIVVTTRSLDRYDDATLDAIEATVGGKYPASFREVMKTLGSGLFAGCLRLPKRKQLEDGATLSTPESWSTLLSGFPNAAEVFGGPIDASTLMTLATSIDGDVIYASRTDADLLVVVPRHRQQLVRASTMLEAFDWFWASGDYWEVAPCPWFTSTVGRDNAELAFDSKRIDDVSTALAEAAEAAGHEVVRVYEHFDGNPGFLFFPTFDAWVQVYNTKLVVEHAKATKEPISWLTEALGAQGVEVKISTHKGSRWG
jgi:hypothetical protein